MPKIFISYRRADNPYAVHSIHRRLADYYGDEEVFFDINTIPPGVDFPTYLNENLNQCEVLLVVMGSNWLSITGSKGNRRLDNPEDWVRQEIERALQQPHILVIPILLDNIHLPGADELPSSLQPLMTRNKHDIRPGRDFDKDIDWLIEDLDKHFYKKSNRIPTFLQTQPKSPEQAPVGWATPITLPPAKTDFLAAQPRQQTPSKRSYTATLGNTAKLQTIKIPAASESNYTELLGNTVKLHMIKIPAGRFSMGSPDHEAERWNSEGPQHIVTVPEFWMGKYPVTQQQWEQVAAFEKVKLDLQPFPSRFKGVTLPVEQVNWYEAVEFCQRLSRKTGRTYRLPSEAEWEYACRAGTTTRYFFGNDINGKQANCDFKSDSVGGLFGTYRGKTTDVGSFPPNQFGLYDLHGNVWEWCADHWHSNYDGAPTDGSAWLTGDELASHVLRGGSWYYSPRYCRSANRDHHDPVYRVNDLGFRVVCSAAGSQSVSTKKLSNQDSSRWSE